MSRRWVSITYDKRTPWAKVQRLMDSVPEPAPTPPPPVVPYYLISGSITYADASAIGFNVPVEFTGIGTITTATSGSYGLLVVEGYGGTAIPHYSLGTFSPTLRTYGSVTSDTPFQDYVYYPYPSPVISGAITLDGSPLSGGTVAFSGDGVATTNGAGLYWGTMAYGYSGTATPTGYSLPTYTVTPTSRVYTNLTTDSTGQNYTIDTNLYDIFGFISSDGTFGAYEVSANGTSWFSDAVTGSYGYTVLGGFSGSTDPTYISNPGTYGYTNVTAEQADQDFDIPVPFLTYAVPTLDWSSWSYALPFEWGVQMQHPVTLAWSSAGSTNGSITTFTVSNFGTYYRVYGRTNGAVQITPYSNEVLADPPDPGSFLISGTVTENGDGAMSGIGVEISGHGTVITNGAGFYSQIVTGGYSGTAIPHYTGGTFNPALLTYTNVLSDQPNQNYVFYGTGSYLISGTLTEFGDGAMVGIGVEVSGHGTIITNGAGVYSQIVSGGYTGSVVPHYTGGTFDPTQRLYSSIFANQSNQNFVFYGTGSVVPPAECPVPSTLFTIPIPVDPKNPSRNVIDPVNNLLWVIDETYPAVYYIDIIGGTYAGSISTGQVGGSPCIVYDALNEKIVITTYDGSMAFINPVTKALTLSNFYHNFPQIHMLAADLAGTIYLCDYNNSLGNVYVVNGATEQLTATYPLDTRFISAICYAENISRVVLANGQGFSDAFYLLDTSNGNFSTSVLGNGSFAATEIYYLMGTGDVVLANGNTAVAIVSIADGTDATVTHGLGGDEFTNGPARAADLTEDTCQNTFFVSDGNYAVFEYTMDGNYTLVNAYNNMYEGFSVTGLAHSRVTNLVYYESYADGTAYTLPYAQYLISGTTTEGGLPLADVGIEFGTHGTIATSNVDGVYRQMVPVHWSGTAIPHYAAGTFQPYSRVYTDVTVPYPDQNYEFFWGGYLFLTRGVVGPTWPSLPNDAVVVDSGSLIVQLHGDEIIYTSTLGRSDWTQRGAVPGGFCIAYNGSAYAVGGAIGALYTSSDLDNWQPQTSGVGGAIISMAYGSNRYVGVCEDGQTIMSTDGVVWNVSNAGTLQLNDVAYAGTNFIAVGADNSGLASCYTSTNGLTWTHRSTPVTTWSGVTYSPELDLVLICGQSNYLAASYDKGVTWVDYTGVLPVVEYYSGIAWGNGRWVITDAQGFVTTSYSGTADWNFVMDDPFQLIGRDALYWKNDWFIILEQFPPT